jgi:hypothetical protein
MADHERCAAFLHVGIGQIPASPESLEYPKQTLINIARRSRDKQLVADMVPRLGTGAQEGPAYASRLDEFVTTSLHCWRPEVAAENAESLRRCLRAIHSIAA